MTADIHFLLEAARSAREKARADYSHFEVGAALLAKSGKVYSGCNIENLSLSLSLCAERVALLKALSEGESEFVALAVVTSSNQPATPCGACRQMLWEYAPDLQLILAGAEGEDYEVASLPELLPRPFRL